MTANKVSFQSNIFFWILKIFNFRKWIERNAEKEISRSNRKFVPGRVKNRFLLNEQFIQDRSVATLENRKSPSKNHIIFFHGGAYIFEATYNHWRLAKKIITKHPCRITLIDYPLAPEHHYIETFDMVQVAYDMLIKKYPDDNFILMGDSAGGGLALAFSMKLNEEKQRILPVGNILLSPWLDLTMSNPEVKPLEDSDYILTIQMLKRAGLKYARDAAQEQYLLSPINGSFKKLPPTIVFYGTNELFYADCIKLKGMVSSNKNFIFKEYKKMQHDWAIFPVPESDRVVEEICIFMDQI